MIQKFDCKPFIVCWMYLPTKPKYNATWSEEDRLIFEDII